jgi:glycerate 2-kinase
MKIAVAPNAFRGSMTALEAANAIADGLRRSRLDVELSLMPLADGGDGTLDVLLSKLDGSRLVVDVIGPNGKPIQAEMALLNNGTAVIESARASGIELVPMSERRTIAATSYGTGQLIFEGLKRGCKRFLIGIGGSAMTDGGAGCLQALGAKLLDTNDQPIARGGGALNSLARVDKDELDRLIHGVEFVVLSDVTNPLIGPNGAAYIFGPQKGATLEEIDQLNQNLSHYADVVARDLGVDARDHPGAGAAGGLGAGLMAFLNAQLQSGAQAIIQTLGYEAQLASCDAVITGEGKLDSQTQGGKAVQIIAQMGRQHKIPVFALAGTLDADSPALDSMGISAAWSIIKKPCTLQEALEHGPEWLTHAAEQLGNTLAI